MKGCLGMTILLQVWLLLTFLRDPCRTTCISRTNSPWGNPRCHTYMGFTWRSSMLRLVCLNRDDEYGLFGSDGHSLVIVGGP